ncbi:MAG TPA: sporulation histidine kinase inhibitor Sda [Bacillota bacterium]|nr:sporulation histidine kinase inhibitor Sda [Bacillota bacterium]
MDILCDKLLMETYVKAKELNLSDEFIALIKKELVKRDLLSKKKLVCKQNKLLNN